MSFTKFTFTLYENWQLRFPLYQDSFQSKIGLSIEFFESYLELSPKLILTAEADSIANKSSDQFPF